MKKTILHKFVSAALIILPISTNLTAAEKKPEQPNFVVFLVDDMGWADVECYGSEFHETPNVNKLASQGMRFTDAYAACPVCSPTRASIMTGKYPASLNLTDFIAGHWRPFARLDDPEFNHALPHEEITIAEMLKTNGYVSGAFGKWHLGPPSHFPDSQGFDEMLVHGGRHFAPNFRMTPDQKYPAGKYLTEILSERAVDFIKDHKDDPFVLYLPHYAVHIPLEAPEDVVEKYRSKRKSYPSHISLVLNDSEGLRVTENKVTQKIERIPFIDSVSVSSSSPTNLGLKIQLSGKADLDETLEEIHRIAKESVESEENYTLKVKSGINNPTYAAMVEMIDRSLGHIMKTLDELKLSDNTVLIFTSDNGGLYRRFDDVGPVVATNAPMLNEKGSLYEGGIRVPFIVRWPDKIQAGTESSLPVSTIDIFPTLASLAGVEYEHPVDGVSLDPILLGQTEEKEEKKTAFEKRELFWHYPHYHHTSPGGIVRKGDYKLIEYFEDGKLELYDLKKDISEQNNLAEENPEIRDELHESLKSWRKKVIAQMPVPNPNYQQEKSKIWGRKGRREELLVPKLPQ